MCAFLTTFGSSMSRFDTGEATPPAERVLEALREILFSPLDPFIGWLPGSGFRAYLVGFLSSSTARCEAPACTSCSTGPCRNSKSALDFRTEGLPHNSLTALFSVFPLFMADHQGPCDTEPILRSMDLDASARD